MSQTCYRHERQRDAENDQIADWLLRLTDNHRNWVFGLCFLYLRNVKDFGWNHKRVYRICRELELNLRIKPRKRLVRQAPEPLIVLVSMNAVWSMDFTHDQLKDGRSIRLGRHHAAGGGLRREPRRSAHGVGQPRFGKSRRTRRTLTPTFFHSKN